MAKIPVEPSLARVLLAGAAADVLAEVVTVRRGPWIAAAVGSFPALQINATDLDRWSRCWAARRWAASSSARATRGSGAWR